MVRSRKYSFIAGGAKLKPSFTGDAQKKPKVRQNSQILD